MYTLRICSTTKNQVDDTVYLNNFSNLKKFIYQNGHKCGFVLEGIELPDGRKSHRYLGTFNNYKMSNLDLNFIKKYKCGDVKSFEINLNLV